MSQGVQGRSSSLPFPPSFLLSCTNPPLPWAMFRGMRLEDNRETSAFLLQPAAWCRQAGRGTPATVESHSAPPFCEGLFGRTTWSRWPLGIYTGTRTKEDPRVQNLRKL